MDVVYGIDVECAGMRVECVRMVGSVRGEGVVWGLFVPCAIIMLWLSCGL